MTTNNSMGPDISSWVPNLEGEVCSFHTLPFSFTFSLYTHTRYIKNQAYCPGRMPGDACIDEWRDVRLRVGALCVAYLQDLKEPLPIKSKSELSLIKLYQVQTFVA